MAPQTRSSTKSEDSKRLASVSRGTRPSEIDLLENSFDANDESGWEYGQNMTSVPLQSDRPDHIDMIEGVAYPIWNQSSINTYSSAMQERSFDHVFAATNSFGDNVQYSEPNEMGYNLHTAATGSTNYPQAPEWIPMPHPNEQAVIIDRSNPNINEESREEDTVLVENSSGSNQAPSRKRTRNGKFLCNILNCKSPCQGRGGFLTQNDLERHHRDVHHINFQDGTPVTLFYCPWKVGCRRRKPFTRRENFQAHMQKKHDGRVPPSQEAVPDDSISEERSAEHSEPSTSMARAPLETSDPVEVTEYPDSLNPTEEGNLGLVGLYKVASGWCDILEYQEIRLQAIDGKLNQLEQHRKDLEEQVSKKEHNAEYFRKLLVKRALTEDKRQWAQQEIYRIEEKEQKHTAKFIHARTRLAELQKSRDEMKQEMPEMSRKARCYMGQLRNKRKEFQHLDPDE